jgi:lauroyl/myristoyl acyltransferase/acyl carrier protein
LARMLPAHMVPSRFVFLNEMPRNANGKIDRRALPALGPKDAGAPADPAAGGTEDERKLIRIFERVLKTSPIGIKDDFFVRGGDSLSYLWLMAEIEKEFGVELSPEQFAGASTIEGLAYLLAPSPGERVEASPTGSPEGSKHRIPLASRLLTSALAGYPYAKGAARLADLAGRRWIQHGLFRREAELVRGVRAAIEDGEPIGEDEAMRRAFAAYLGRKWRSVALARCAPAEFDRWVAISGLEHLAAAAARGNGVLLLTSHYALVFVIPLAFHASGFDDLLFILRQPALLKVAGLESDYRQAMAGGVESADTPLSAQLYRGRQTLRRGGAVLIEADGALGASLGLPLPFLGRRRIFKTGFAELALDTGAAVIPVSLSMSLGGRFEISYLPELRVGEGDHEEQVASLVRQYAAILEDQWREGWWNFHWPQLRIFLRLPLVDGSGDDVPRSRRGG